MVYYQRRSSGVDCTRLPDADRDGVFCKLTKARKLRDKMDHLSARHSPVICPSGALLAGLSSLISDFPKNISVPT
jgi:hypothetical protein